MQPRRHFARHNDDMVAMWVARFSRSKSKPQPRFSTPQLAGLRAIAELPRLARRILMYLGERQLRTEDAIDIWPLDRFTVAAADGSLWP
jgi:hypothetical protein